jgi:hypothetical protein
VGVDHRVAGQGRHDRRRHHQDRDPVPLDEGEEPPEVEARHRHHRGARRQRQRERGHEAHDVEERRHRQQRVAPGHAQAAVELAQHGDQVGVGEHDPLGQPGGAAGVGQQRDRAGVDGDVRARGVAVQQRGDRGGARGFPEHEHLAHAGRRGRRTGGRQQRRDGHQDGRARVRQLPGRLALGVGGVNAGHRAAGGHRAERDPGPLRQVGRPQRQHVTGPQAAVGQPRRQALHPRRQLGEADRQPVRPVDQRRPLRRSAGRRRGDPVQGGAADLDRLVVARPRHLLPPRTPV